MRLNLNEVSKLFKRILLHQRKFWVLAICVEIVHATKYGRNKEYNWAFMWNLYIQPKMVETKSTTKGGAYRAKEFSCYFFLRKSIRLEQCKITLSFCVRESNYGHL